MAADYSKFVTSGLTGAQSAINNNYQQPYPTYTGGSKSNPYATQQSAAGMASSGYDPTKGVYGGIGRDANSIRADYQGTVDQSWDKSQSAIKNMYGANGLYGSMGGGLMSGVALDGAQNYANASAQGRLTADQAIMADGIARSNSYRDAYELAGNQNLDKWKTGQTALEYNNQLLGNRTQFGNDQIDAAYQDQLARRADTSAYKQTQIENYLGLAGGGSPNAAAQMQSNAQQSAANTAAKASNTASLIGAAGALGGGLLGGIGEANGWSNFWK